MSEQTNSTENTEVEKTETTAGAENESSKNGAGTQSAPVATARPQPKAAPKRAPAPVVEDDEDEDNDPYDDDDDDYHIPSEYAPSGSGRPRRIGSDVKVEDIDYKKVAVLSRFLDSRGRILSRRKTRVSAKVQRRIVVAIKRARHLALLPYTADQTRIVRKRR
ncbi:MAG: 30S ribosomal protein S18 [Caldilineaceae bacterium]|nr:30S ribosomal protein S18 [Caldilineaceae bacterium]